MSAPPSRPPPRLAPRAVAKAVLRMPPEYFSGGLEGAALQSQRAAGNKVTEQLLRSSPGLGGMEEDEIERARWNAAMQFGQESDRLSPAQQREREEQDALSRSPRTQAALAASKKPQEEGPSVVDQAQEVAETAGSWLVGYGQWNAARDAGAIDVGRSLADAAGARTKPFRQIADELDQADSPDRVALAFMDRLPSSWLDFIASSADGQYLLRRIYAQLAEGNTGPVGAFVRGMLPVPVSDDTRRLMEHQSRIMKARMAAVSIDRYATAASGVPKTFPFKLPGLSTLRETPMDVREADNGNILVELPTKMPGQYPDEYKTLPPEIINKRIEIDADEIILIRHYDEGERLEPVPAFYLLLLKQRYEQANAETIQLTASVGAAVGSGSAQLAGSEGLSKTAGTASRLMAGGTKALALADRAMLVWGPLSKVINENRSWLAAQREPDFREVLQAFDFVNRVAQVYGLVRLSMAAPQLLQGLHKRYGSWRERRLALRDTLPAEKLALLNEIDQQIRSIPDPVSATPAARKSKGPVNPDNFDITGELPDAQQRVLADQPALWDGAPSSKPATAPARARTRANTGSADLPSAEVIDFIARQKAPAAEPPRPQLEVQPPELRTAQLPVEAGMSLAGRTRAPTSPTRNVEPVTSSSNVPHPASSAESSADASGSRPGVSGLGLYDPALVSDVVVPTPPLADVAPFDVPPSAPLTGAKKKPLGRGRQSAPSSEAASTEGFSDTSLDKPLAPVRQEASSALPKPLGLEVDTGPRRWQDEAQELSPVDLVPSGQSDLELDPGPRSGSEQPRDPHEVDLEPLPAGKGPKLYRGSKPANRIPGVRARQQAFGDASGESSGTHRRTGMEFNSLNAAEIAQGMQIDYDPVAGRPNSVTCRVDRNTAERTVQSERAFKRDTSTDGAQATDASYAKTGWDKGHLGQREAFKGDADVELAADLMTNVVPMAPNLNRGPGSPWRAAETQAMTWADQYGSVSVTLTPIYDANPPRLADGTPIPKAIHRKVTAPSGQVLEDLSYLNL